MVKYEFISTIFRRVNWFKSGLPGDEGMKQISFGTDGWRGILAEDFNFANVQLVARSIGMYILKGGLALPHITAKIEDNIKALVGYIPASEKAGLKGIVEPMPGAWVLIRASGTEPLFRIYVEAGTPEEVKEIQGDMKLYWLSNVARYQKKNSMGEDLYSWGRNKIIGVEIWRMVNLFLRRR